MAKKSIGLLNIVFGANLKGFNRAMKKAQKSIRKFGSNMKKAGRTLTMGLTMPIIAFAAASVRAFGIQAKAEIKLLTALKGRHKLQQRLIAQAKELQTKTLFGDEENIAPPERPANNERLKLLVESGLAVVSEEEIFFPGM